MNDRCEPLDWNAALLPCADLLVPEPGTTCTCAVRQRSTGKPDTRCHERTWEETQALRLQRQWDMSLMQTPRILAKAGITPERAADLRARWTRSWPAVADYFNRFHQEQTSSTCVAR